MAPYRKETWNDYKWARRLFMAIVVLAALAQTALFILERQDRGDIRREAVQRAVQVQNETRRRASEIQRERYQVTLRNCKDQNARHAATIRALGEIINKLPPDQKPQAERGVANTVLLLNALVPKRDCRQVAKDAITLKGKK